jgi:hypothetical protein
MNLDGCEMRCGVREQEFAIRTRSLDSLPLPRVL